jgi:hypothetical protein
MMRHGAGAVPTPCTNGRLYVAACARTFYQLNTIWYAIFQRAQLTRDKRRSVYGFRADRRQAGSNSVTSG